MSRPTLTDWAGVAALLGFLAAVVLLAIFGGRDYRSIVDSGMGAAGAVLLQRAMLGASARAARQSAEFAPLTPPGRQGAPGSDTGFSPRGS